MRLFRVAKHNYINDLSGEGARLYGGRWNEPETAVLYFSEHLSLCVLETLARVDYEFLRMGYSFLEVEIDDNSITKLADPQFIDANWNTNPPNSATQRFGTDWVNSENSLALSTPSAVLFEECNVLVNPNHKAISTLKVVRTKELILDERILK